MDSVQFYVRAATFKPGSEAASNFGGSARCRSTAATRCQDGSLPGVNEAPGSAESVDSHPS